jgi:hypothetical protein
VRTGKHITLAASAGASVFPHDGATYEALLADADQRMYRDKAARRGQLAEPAPQPPAEFVPADTDGERPAARVLNHPRRLSVA